MDGTYALPKEWHEYVRKYTLIVNDEKPIDSLTRYLSVDPKYHTIRAGHRWKVGDKFSPRQWSGKAYRSKQVIIGPDIEIKKTWRVSVINRSIYIEGAPVTTYTIERLAINDGLSFADLLHWFMPLKKNPAPDWHGQIICWNEKIEY